jgi:hypothetical protein
MAVRVECTDTVRSFPWVVALVNTNSGISWATVGFCNAKATFFRAIGSRAKRASAGGLPLAKLLAAVCWGEHSTAIGIEA